MSIELEMILNILVTTVPYRFLAYYPFLDHLRCKKSIVIFIIILTELPFLLLPIVLSKYGFGNAFISQAVVSSQGIWAAVCFLFYYLCVKVKFTKLLFFYLFITEYIMIVRGVAIFVTGLIFTGAAAEYYSWQGSVIQLLLFSTALPFMISFFKRTANRILDAGDYAIWRTIWLPPALTTIIILMFTGSLETEVTQNWSFLITRICLLITTFVIYYILLRSLDIFREHTMLEERARQAEAINDMQKAQYNLMKKRIEETKIARHDLRQHLNMIQAYLDSGNNEALESYLNEYKKSLPKDTAQIYCKNYAVDVVVRYYAHQAEANGIHFYTRLNFPKTLAVTEPDTCVILGNLLENALEACKRQSRGDKFIRICGQIVGENAVSLTIDNSCENEPAVVGSDYLSSKRNETETGTGLLSSKHIADKYNGVVRFKYDSGIFYASVLLNP